MAEYFEPSIRQIWEMKHATLQILYKLYYALIFEKIVP